MPNHNCKVLVCIACYLVCFLSFLIVFFCVFLMCVLYPGFVCLRVCMLAAHCMK